MAPRQRLPASWYIQFFRRHKDDDPSETIPGREFLRGDGRNAAMKLQAILQVLGRPIDDGRSIRSTNSLISSLLAWRA